MTDTVEESASGSIPGVGPVSATVGADFDLITLRGLWHAPLSWGSFFVGAGYFDGEVNAFVDLTEGTSSLHVEDTASEDGPTAILGLQWDLTRLSLRVEYEWWDIEDADAEQIGAGVHFRF